MKFNIQNKIALGAISLAAALNASAGTVTVSSKNPVVEQDIVSTKDEKTWCEKLWEIPVLYKNEDNPYIQEFALQGRLQVQFADGSSDQGDFDTGDVADENRWGDFEVRRFRLGAKMKFLRKFKLEGQINANPNFDAFYRDIYDLYLLWSPNDNLTFGVGKEKVKFTQEQATTSKEILTFERSLLSNLVFPGELTGAWMRAKQGDLDYSVAAYANDRQREFSRFDFDNDDVDAAGNPNGTDTGIIAVGKVGYNLGTMMGVEKMHVGFDYMYNSQPGHTETGVKLGNNRFATLRSPRFNHNFALNADFAQGPYAVNAEAIYANDDEASHSNVYGFQIMPSVFIAKSLQLVTRFQIAHSDGDNGLPVFGRYDALAPDVRFATDKAGDTYYAFYAGLNYYLCGHKLKVMTGVEYGNMDGGNANTATDGHTNNGDYDGFTYLLGARMYF